ncbi:MAG: hypothetical protein K0U61_00840, partial [Alphaproteobacteria bacterium]|nr:hypothetical protein [Alphaproteobacteria bacterium]
MLSYPMHIYILLGLGSILLLFSLWFFIIMKARILGPLSALASIGVLLFASWLWPSVVDSETIRSDLAIAHGDLRDREKTIERNSKLLRNAETEIDEAQRERAKALRRLDVYFQKVVRFLHWRLSIRSGPGTLMLRNVSDSPEDRMNVHKNAPL